MGRLLGKLWRFPSKSRNCLALPLSASFSLRIAQVGSGPRLGEPVHIFSEGRWGELSAFAPDVLLGTIPDLQRFMEAMRSERVPSPSVHRAICVLTTLGARPIDDCVRRALWQAFGVPTFEILVSSTGKILASECEAHEGWHIMPGTELSVVSGRLVWQQSGDRAAPTGLRARIEADPCSCDRPGRRLLDIESLPAIDILQDIASHELTDPETRELIRSAILTIA